MMMQRPGTAQQQAFGPRPRPNPARPNPEEDKADKDILRKIIANRMADQISPDPINGATPVEVENMYERLKGLSNGDLRKALVDSEATKNGKDSADHFYRHPETAEYQISPQLSDAVLKRVYIKNLNEKVGVQASLANKLDNIPAGELEQLISYSLKDFAEGKNFPNFNHNDAEALATVLNPYWGAPATSVTEAQQQRAQIADMLTNRSPYTVINATRYPHSYGDNSGAPGPENYGRFGGYEGGPRAPYIFEPARKVLQDVARSVTERQDRETRERQKQQFYAQSGIKRAENPFELESSDEESMAYGLNKHLNQPEGPDYRALYNQYLGGRAEPGVPPAPSSGAPPPSSNKPGSLAPAPGAPGAPPPPSGGGGPPGGGPQCGMTCHHFLKNCQKMLNQMLIGKY